MSMPFVQALNTEIATLEAELRADPRFTKLRELERVRDLYVRSIPVVQSVPARPAQPVAETHTEPKRQISANRQALKTAAADIIRGRTAPTPTRDILNALLANGHTIPGGSPGNSLSALLSQSDEFKSHGRIGWTLDESDTMQPRNTEAAGSPDQDESPAASMSLV